MNKSESKYFNTALKMDKAFLELLEHKDFEYITVKEICEKAGVNRSTFYLHYETVSDLLSESVQYMIEQFLSYMKVNPCNFVSRLHDCSQEELYLITPKYLTPYLTYIAENKRLFCTTVKNAASLHLEDAYSQMSKYVLMPILDRFNVSSQSRNYIMAFYINGLMAIITEWLKNDCGEPIENIIKIMQQCVTAKLD